MNINHIVSIIGIPIGMNSISMHDRISISAGRSRRRRRARRRGRSGLAAPPGKNSK